MSLEDYQKKRNFKLTREPEGQVAPGANTPIFVVQKHDASHLHYDLRLEIDGVLKSWAVPKGPSMNPEEKRFAVQTEDHPYEYKDFEGIIPEGNYGAGTVEIWDKGNFLPVNGKVEDLSEAYKKGHLSIIFNGQKLKGEFGLVRFKSREPGSWLLIKANDQYAKSN